MWRRSLTAGAAAMLLACRGEGSTLDSPTTLSAPSLSPVTIATAVIAAISLAVAQRTLATTRAWRRSLARAGVPLDALGLFGIALAGTLPLALRAC